MFGSRKALSAVFTATLIALGALVTWYLVVFPVVQYFEARKARSRLYEQLTVLADGTPLLAVSRGGIAAAEYRDLQGDVVAKGPFPSALQGTGFQAATQPSAPDLPHPIAPAVSLPVDVGVFPGWRGRIMGLSDRPGAVEGPATLWYFIRGPRNRGGGYFQGYDERTRQLIGFIGAEGYQANRPVGDERLVLGEDFDANRIATTQYAYFGQPSLNYYWPASVGSPENVYMALPDKLVQIDLSRPSLTTFAEIAGVVAIAIGPRATEEGGETLYARTSENILVLDADGTAGEKFPVPSEIQHDNLVVYRLSNEQVVMDATRDYYQHQLLWVSADGNVERREEVKLGAVSDPFSESPTAVALLAPLPVAMAGAMIMDATSQMQRAQGASLSQSLTSAVTRSAAPTFIYVLLSAVLAWLVYQRETSDGKRGVGWAVFVFLLGIPGVIGYLFHRDSSARIPCAQCQKPVLRNRADCSSCGEPFARPSRLGTEIFA